jgi:hypothetical protein
MASVIIHFYSFLCVFGGAAVRRVDWGVTIREEANLHRRVLGKPVYMYLW